MNKKQLKILKKANKKVDKEIKIVERPDGKRGEAKIPSRQGNDSRFKNIYRQRRDTQFKITISKDLKYLIKSVAKEQGVSQTDLAVTALIKYMEGYEYENNKINK